MTNPVSQMLSMATVVQLVFQSIGVVYGDIGTSPLYVYVSTFPDGIKHPDDILGALSLMLWSQERYAFCALRFSIGCKIYCNLFDVMIAACSNINMDS